jgi:hypothetical protein
MPDTSNRTQLESFIENHLYKVFPFCDAPPMSKRLMPFLGFLVLTGCTSVFTNLTPQTQVRNTNNLYTVEAAMTSRQQTLRWDSIKPQILVGAEVYPMRPTLLMTNRWEGLIPVAPGTNLTHYRYKFDFQYNTMGGSRSDSALSPEYSLRILDKAE